jgi:hypothetical protein
VLLKKYSLLALEGCWIFMVLLLPVTSMPLVAQLTGAASVAAPSGVILFFLIILWIIPYLYHGGAIPRQAIPLSGFFLVSLAACAGAFFLDVPSFKSTSIIRGEIQGLRSAWPFLSLQHYGL